MILSLIVLSNALKNDASNDNNESYEQDRDISNPLRYSLYHNKRVIVPPEFYGKKHKNQNKTLKVTIAIILLILEIFFLYFGINMAVKVSRSTSELIIHMLLAILLTIPYVFANAVFNTEAYKAYLRK